MNERALRFRIGTFVVASLLVLVMLMWLFGGIPAFYVPVNHYTILFDDATGLAPGTPVRRAGVRIGEVSKVEIDEESGQVRVEIEVQKKHTIRRNEQPVLRRSILGDASIDFVAGPLPESPPPAQPVPEPGQPELGQADVAFVEQVAQAKPAPPPDRSPVPPGSTLKGVQQTDVPASLNEVQKAAASFNRLAPQFEKTLGEANVAIGNWGRVGERVERLMRDGLEDKIVKAVDNANKTMERVANTFSDENQRNLNASLKNFRAASDQLETLTKDTDHLVKESQATLKQINNSLTKADSVMANMEKATRPLADRGESLMKNLDESAVKLNRLLTDMQDLFRGTAKGDGTLPRLLNDPELYNNLNAAACGVARMIPQLHRILKDVEVFADKIARHPEALGVGGAVRPGSGLK